MSGFINAIGLAASGLALIEFADTQIAEKDSSGTSIRIKGATSIRNNVDDLEIPSLTCTTPVAGLAEPGNDADSLVSTAPSTFQHHSKKLTRT
jgi:hypothetical protein